MQTFVTPISKGQFRKSASQNIDIGNLHDKQRKSSAFNKDDSGSDKHVRKDGGENFSDKIRGDNDKNSEKGAGHSEWRNLGDTKNFRDLKDSRHGESAPIINIISKSNTGFDSKNNVFAQTWNKSNTFSIAEKPPLARIDEEDSAREKLQPIIAPNPNHAESIQTIQDNETLMRSLGYLDWKSPPASKARGDIQIDVESPVVKGKTPGFADSPVLNSQTYVGVVNSEKGRRSIGGNLISHKKALLESKEEDIAQEFFNTSPTQNPEVFGDSGLEKVTIGQDMESNKPSSGGPNITSSLKLPKKRVAPSQVSFNTFGSAKSGSIVVNRSPKVF